MARQHGFGHFLNTNSAPISSDPVSISVLLRPQNATPASTEVVLELFGDGGEQELSLRLHTSGKPRVEAFTDGHNRSLNHSAIYSAASWQQFGVGFDGTEIEIVLAGIREKTVGTAIGFDLLSSLKIGGSYIGDVAEVALWNVTLTDAEWAMLSGDGTLFPSPRFVRPDALVALWRLVDDDDDRDLVGGVQFSASAVSYTSHPPVIVPSPPQFTYVKGVQGFTLAGIPSAEAIGTARLRNTIHATGIATAEAFGSTFIGSRVSPQAIASAEAFGTTTIKVDTEITPSGIASVQAFGSHFVGDFQIIIPIGIASEEAIGGPGLTVELLKRLRPLCPIFASDRPFEGQGISVYANIGETIIYRTPRVVAKRFRNRRRIWVKGPAPRLPIGTNPIPKTTRRVAAAGTAGDELDIPFNLPDEFAGETIVIDVRHYRDDVENLSSNFRTVRVELDGTLNEVQEIRGTAVLLEPEIRAGGIVRLRWRWIAASDGLQPTLFRASRTAGPTSPAAVTTTASGSRIYELDTPALNSAAYTYKITAENGAVTKDVLTGITFTADASGPPAVTAVLADAR